MLITFVSLLVYSQPSFAAITVTDDDGQVITLQQPARRIISLAPHITELLFAGGAGDYIVGASSYSDFPPAARSITRIGNGASLDLERIVALQPDLVVAWQSGNPAGQLVQLRALGLTVFLSEPSRLEDIGTTLARFGELAETQPLAQLAIDNFSKRLAALRKRNANKTPVSVFYQVWDRPLMTVNDAHIISHVIRLCGGINVFADLSQLAPQIGIEAVLQRNPQAIIAAADGPAGTQVLAGWRRWPELSAVQRRHLYTVPGDVLVRQTPRILEGVERMCVMLDQVREDDR